MAENIYLPTNLILANCIELYKNISSQQYRSKNF